MSWFMHRMCGCPEWLLIACAPNLSCLVYIVKFYPVLSYCWCLLLCANMLVAELTAKKYLCEVNPIQLLISSMDFWFPY